MSDDDTHGHLVSEPTDGPTLDRVDIFILGIVVGLFLAALLGWLTQPSPPPEGVIPL